MHAIDINSTDGEEVFPTVGHSRGAESVISVTPWALVDVLNGPFRGGTTA